MINKIAIILSFIFFSLLITLVGIFSAKYKTNTTSDYLLASRNVNPWLTALSAMSTGKSGFLFTGQVGYAYLRGIETIWLVIPWAIGDYLAWWLIFPKLRQISEETDSENDLFQPPINEPLSRVCLVFCQANDRKLSLLLNEERATRIQGAIAEQNLIFP
ncbi:MAG: hypothetical protein AB4062_04075 [Crocosphaera sp.]